MTETYSVADMKAKLRELRVVLLKEIGLAENKMTMIKMTDIEEIEKYLRNGVRGERTPMEEQAVLVSVVLKCAYIDAQDLLKEMDEYGDEPLPVEILKKYNETMWQVEKSIREAREGA